MRRIRSTRFVGLTVLAISLSAVAAVVIPNLQHFRDVSGAVATFNTAGNGNLDEKNAFFQNQGTNGRSCASCHQPAQAFSITPEAVQEVYHRTHGQDPIFAAVDGANCPTGRQNDEDAHSLLLQNGLIRVAITLHANPQFTIEAVHDPYKCAISYDPTTGSPIVSVYRRPAPTTNLRYLSGVMFDGRETLLPLNDAATVDNNLRVDLTDQALSAITGHNQGSNPSAATLGEIVNFELGLSTAQIHNDDAGSLHAHGATGGPQLLSSQPYYPGSNDALGGDPKGLPFNPSAFTLYTAWDKNKSHDRYDDSDKDQNREDIAAGEKLFNTKPAIITGVRGINDNPALGNPASVTGTCTTCHDTPNVGNHSVSLPLDIAVSRQAKYESNPTIVAGLRELSAPDLPVYEIRGCPDPSNPKKTVTFYTSDPGKGLITGQCADINRGKGPILRGIAARAPYFHNGSAANLDELVNFYNKRFEMNLTAKEKKQLIAFLNSL